MKTKEKHNRKLLVEGNDDRHVIWALCKQFGIDETFDVIDCGGIENLYDALQVRFKQSDIQTIGIIVDADTNLHSRWMHIRELLFRHGFPVPDSMPEEGLILSNAGGIRVGVWIMPDNNLNGMLEDFISFLIPEDDKLLPLVRTALDRIESQNLNRYSLIHRSKAIIHSWLAWQEYPGVPMGLSITKRYLTTDREICRQLIQWLRTLLTCE
ncbi:MAG: hypothetical protein LBR10_10995 [Prevotellaceae bacterium]|jgi:hypothetical protein|nr:hypothetical protein [Prevotellaceae bacterium]